MRKSVSKKLTGAILWTLCFQALPGVAGAMPTYQLDDSTVTVDRYEEPKAEPVEIPAEPEAPDEIAGGNTARTADYGTLGKRDVMTTPFNMTTFTEKMIQDRQAASVNDVIANDASTTDQTLSGASQAWNIRGFKSTQQDVSFNGLYGVAPRFYSGVEGLDRVEVLKGPGALLYGMAPNGSVGGNINFVPKRAKAGENQNSLTLSFGNGRQFGQDLDLSHRTEDGKTGVRLNVFHTNGSTSNSDESINTNAMTLGIDHQVGKSKMSLDLGYAYNKIDNMQYRLTFGSGYLGVKDLPSADHNKKYGAPDTFRHVTEKYGMYKYDYKFDDNVNAYFAIGARETKMEYLYNDFRLNAKGTASIRYHVNNQINKANSMEVGVKDKFHTGEWKHKVTLSANRYNMKRYMKNRTGSYFATSYDNPVWGTNTLDHSWQEPLNDETTLSGIALTDVISNPGEDWTFILGGRYQKVKQDVYTGSASYDSDAWTPAFGVVKKLGKRVSLYANYIEGLTAGDVVSGGYKNDGAVLSPYKAKQVEAGVKYDMGKALATLSAFQIKQNGSMEKDDVLTSSGEVRHRGVEASLSGEPVKGTRLWGSLMYMDAKYTEDADYQGNYEMGIPKWTAVVGAEQDIHGVKGLSVNTRVTYNGSAYVDQANTTKVPQWYRWDAGVKYEFTGFGHHPMTLRADVYNLLNKSYWNALNGSTPALYLGTGRTALVSMEMKF